MNPLSIWTYYRRHKQRSALLLSLISLVTIGLYLMTALSWAIFVEPLRSSRLFLSKFGIAMPPRGEAAAGVVAQIRANPDVAQVVPVMFGHGISLPEMLGGATNWLNLLGVWEEDLPYLLEVCAATLQEGQLLQPRTNGIMLSQQVAASLGLQVGDIIHDSIDPKLYGNIFDPMEVVAILESDVRLGILSAEYMESHEIYHTFPTRFLVVAHEGREAAVDDFLRNEIQTTRTTVWTLQTLNEQMAGEYRATYTLLAPIITTVAIAVAFVVGVVNRIAFTRRVSEFGILHAAGHSKRWLIRRLTMETSLLAALGWLIGIGLSWLILYLFKLAVFAPRGQDLRVITGAAVVLVIPVPLALVGYTRISVGRILSRLDPVAVVERGDLSLQERYRRPEAKSSPRPLATLTFFRRHRRRGMLLTSAMALMILAVVLVVFLNAATYDAQKASLGELKRMSKVSIGVGSSLGPGVAAQIRAHPAVERVIPAHQQTMLSMLIPPFGSANIHPYAVYAEDLTYLVDLYDRQLQEGHLPRPRSNEIVIPQVVAQNRDLQVGDVIGRLDRPAYPGAMGLPAEFVISGIFAPPATAEEENWLCFVSLEFLESHEGFHFTGTFRQFLVVPKAGQKETMDDWLESELTGAEVDVLTYRQAVSAARESLRTMVLTAALLESVIAIVAAITLTVLNYLSMAQRQAEYGLLHALGFGRLRLVWRTVWETASSTGIAWGLSALLCLGGLLYLQYGLFAPLGLRLNLLNPAPWLLTLPIPAVVLAVTATTIAWTLSKLDPVSIIERR